MMFTLANGSIWCYSTQKLEGSKMKNTSKTQKDAGWIDKHHKRTFVNSNIDKNTEKKNMSNIINIITQKNFS